MLVLVGGTHTKPNTKATSREWLDKQQTGLTDPRNLRRQDLGFRTISETKPSE